MTAIKPDTTFHCDDNEEKELLLKEVLEDLNAFVLRLKGATIYLTKGGEIDYFNIQLKIKYLIAKKS